MGAVCAALSSFVIKVRSPCWVPTCLCRDHNQNLIFTVVVPRENQFDNTFLFVFLSVQFVQSIGLDKRSFHVVGTSMGGNVAGVYAASYPDYLCGATLICPAGKHSRHLV